MKKTMFVALTGALVLVGFNARVFGSGSYPENCVWGHGPRTQPSTCVNAVPRITTDSGGSVIDNGVTCGSNPGNNTQSCGDATKSSGE